MLSYIRPKMNYFIKGRFMEQENTGKAPQRGVLLRRAHELLEHVGQPVAEDLLLEHLFGVTGVGQKNAVWQSLLRQVLKSASLFEEAEPRLWSLVAWRYTQRSLDEIEFVVVDTETTGLRPGSHRVIEVAGVRIRGGEVLGSYQSLLNPGVRVPLSITRFTGISQEMVAAAPKSHEALPDFLSFVEGAIVVGHNVGFDIGFLSYEAQLLGWSFPIDGLDTIPLARRFLPGLKRCKSSENPGRQSSSRPGRREGDGSDLSQTARTGGPTGHFDAWAVAPPFAIARHLERRYHSGRHDKTA